MTFEDSIKQIKEIAKRLPIVSIPMVTSEFVKDSNYFAPKAQGDLIDSSYVHSDYDKGEAIWQTPYARRLFYNPQYKFSKDANPQARGLWAEVAKNQNLDKYKRLTNNALKELKQDVIK